jgi:hypothetical protein
MLPSGTNLSESGLGVFSVWMNMLRAPPAAHRQLPSPAIFHRSVTPFFALFHGRVKVRWGGEGYGPRALLVKVVVLHSALPPRPPRTLE